MIDLKGKVAVVTGGSSGIGYSTAKLLSKYGAHVVITYLKSKDSALSINDDLDNKIMVVKTDVSDENQVNKIITKTVEKYGQIDILVNSAGVLSDSLLLMTKTEFVKNMIDVNVMGTYYAMRRVTKQMIKQKSGKIINISSVVGRYGNSGQTAYSMTKSAIIGLTISAAKELGRFGITVNAVAPGLIETNMSSHLPDSAKNELISNISLGRIGTPEDVSNVLLFLCSPLSNYISGQIIGVDGCQIL
jgi:3-oxoacyl-[acyl-carrier protein] reductase